MNARQKLHQASLERWALLIKAQEDSDLIIKTWCEQNNVSFNAYNYWKHLLKEEYVDSCMSYTLYYEYLIIIPHS